MSNYQSDKCVHGIALDSYCAVCEFEDYTAAGYITQQEITTRISATTDITWVLVHDVLCALHNMGVDTYRLVKPNRP